MALLQGSLGLLALVGLAWACSENRRGVDWKLATLGLLLLFGIAAAVHLIPGVEALFLGIDRVVGAVRDATLAGSAFVFGYVGGAEPPFAPIAGRLHPIMAFQILPMVLVVSVLSAILFYWRLMPRVVGAFAWVLGRTVGVSGAAGTSSAASVFLGLVEAPLVVRPYLPTLPRSDLFLIMTASLATIAGSVMVVFATILEPVVPNALGHILTASVMQVAASIVIARLMVPMTADERAQVGRDPFVFPPSPHKSLMDAITRGTLEAVPLFINIVAMLIVLIALVALIDRLLALLPVVAGAPLSLERGLGVVLAPLTWLMGVPWIDALGAGTLLGTKCVLNEFLAYLKLAEQGAALAPRSRLILVYALCGFANPGSLGILVGGLSAILPQRQRELVTLGPKALLAAYLANCLSGTAAGLLLGSAR